MISHYDFPKGRYFRKLVSLPIEPVNVGWLHGETSSNKKEGKLTNAPCREWLQGSIASTPLMSTPENFQLSLHCNPLRTINWINLSGCTTICKGKAPMPGFSHTLQKQHSQCEELFFIKLQPVMTYAIHIFNYFGLTKNFRWETKPIK